MKSLLWRVAKSLSHTEDSRCLKVNVILSPDAFRWSEGKVTIVSYDQQCPFYSQPLEYSGKFRQFCYFYYRGNPRNLRSRKIRTREERGVPVLPKIRIAMIGKV